MLLRLKIDEHFDDFIDFDDFHSESILTNTYTADLIICCLKSYVQNFYKVSHRYCGLRYFKLGQLNMLRFGIFLVFWNRPTSNDVWVKKYFGNSQKRKKISNV